MMRSGWILTGLVFTLVGCDRRQTLPPPKAIEVREDGVIALRMATLNIRYENDRDIGPRHWRTRSAITVKTLAQLDLDIFAVQEALHGQVADLRASLPDFDFIGVGRDDGSRGGEYTGLFYRRDRFAADPVEQGTFWLSDTPFIPGSMTWGNRFPRTVTWIRLTDRATDRSFYTYATHWDHQNQASRERGALALASHMDQRAHLDEPVVLLGDFNSTLQNRAVAYLLGSSQLGRTARWKHALKPTYQSPIGSKSSKTTLHFWRGPGEGYQVDHILVSAHARVLQGTIVAGEKPYASDHFPVMAAVEFPPP